MSPAVLCTRREEWTPKRQAGMRGLARRFARILGVLLCAGATVRAQNPDGPKQKSPEQAHRFFDGLNVGLIAAEAGALVADGITTQYGIRHYGGGEADPFARPFVKHGWPGMIAGGALFISAEVGLRYLLHKKHHHRAERWLPTFVIGYGATGAIYNSVQIYKVRQPFRP
jgi:hypothetical protein